METKPTTQPALDTPKQASNARGPQKKQGDSWRSALGTAIMLLAAPLVALVLVMFVFQSYQVDGPSMETTLHNRDRLIVTKVQRTWARITGHDYIPHRGDIIIFYEPSLQKQLIKRVIGLPGDRVVVRDGVVTVYNSQHPGGYEPDKAGSWGTVIPMTSGDIDVTIKADEVFVCGDNRVNSRDSRELGPIESKNIVGKLQLRVYPLNTAEVF